MRNIIIVMALLFVANSMMAQPKDKEKIEAMRVAFITKKLELTPKEAEKFWPIYNEYHAKLNVIRRDLRKNKRSVEDKTDKELEQTLKAYYDLREKELALEKTYSTKFLKVLPIKKVLKLRSAEEEFKRWILQQYRKDKPRKRQR